MPQVPPFRSEARRRLQAVGWLTDERAVEPLGIVWSGPDPDGAVTRLVDYVEAAGPHLDPLSHPQAARRLAYVVGLSRQLSLQLIRHPEWLYGADPAALVGVVRSTLAAVGADEAAGVCTVAEGGRRLSKMADTVVAQILDEELASGGPPLAVVAMGKWGGNELNYWSDIDLVFVSADGPEDARAASRVAAAVMRRLAGSPDGEVILRADAGLRPEGSQGPLARSLAAYRAYYERWAEPWEFQALLKARHAAGDAGIGEAFLDLVSDVLWPETVDADAIRSLRAMKARTEDSADADDLKRAPGGIRDIEFAVQILQLVHGRFDPDLRRTGTLEVLEALSLGGYIDGDDGAHLAEAYQWLRSAEHRIQLWDLRPTHIVPPAPEDRERLARALRYRDSPSRSARQEFEADLVSHRRLVRRIHEDLYFRPLLEAFASTPTGRLSREGAERRLVALGFRDVARAVRTFGILTRGMSRRSRLMQQMLPLILDWLADSPDPDLGLEQVRLLGAGMVDHTELITTLRDRPVVGQRLAYLLGSSRLLGRYLDRIPEFVARLDDDRVLSDLGRREQLEDRLRRRLDSRPESDHVGTLRRFARRQMVRVAARDLLALGDVEDTMRDLTAAADAAVAAAASLAEAEEGLAVIAMGGWGGEELSYASDLDLLYVHDDSLDAASALRRASRLREMLTSPSADGAAWDLDAGLRPEGKSGPLVRSLASYATYYERWAETWELQALTKARPVAGDPALGEAFMDAATPFVWSDPFPDSKATEIRRMKARIENERIPINEDPDFHLKLGPGGMVDIEFLAQLLQLRHGGSQPELRTPVTLTALRRLADYGHLAPEQADHLVAAYRFCGHVRNRLFLQAGRRLDSLPRDPEDEWRLARSLGYERRGDLREEYRRLTRRARRIFEDLFY